MGMMDVIVSPRQSLARKQWVLVFFWGNEDKPRWKEALKVTIELKNSIN